MKRTIINESFFPVITKKDRALPFYVTTIGKSTEQNLTIRRNGLPSHQLLYTAEGSGTAVFFGKEYSIEKGSLYFCPANSAHEYYSKEEPWVTYWITFNGTAFSHFFNYEQGIWTTPGNFDFISEYKKIFSLKDSAEWAKNSGVALYRLLCRYLDFIPYNSENAVLKYKLSPALEYIENNYGDYIEIRTLAELTGVSFEHFCRIFKSCTGITPVKYVTTLRINKAKEALIKSRSMSVSEIAALSGFESAAYFSKQFKKSEGITPTDFRKMYLYNM